MVLAGIILMGILLISCTPTYEFTLPVVTTEITLPSGETTTMGVSSPVTTKVSEIQLGQNIIDAGIADCENATTWGIDLADISINYITGIGVRAAIILHNGDDAERVVKLSYTPMRATSGYAATPPQAGNWFAIDITQVRMEKMETIVVPVHLYVPEGTTGLPNMWIAGIEAEGLSILTYEQEMEVMTDPDDNGILDARLAQPLLLNDVKAVISIQSDLPEDNLVIKGYDPSETTLTIGGFAQGTVRNVTVTFEYRAMIGIAYDQRWLITMTNQVLN